MKSRQISDRNGERIFVVVYEAGEAFHEPLVSLANQTNSDRANLQRSELFGAQQ
jgi:hypothetical protein